MDSAPTYLVVIDKTAESQVALRFAVLRAAHIGGKVALLAVVPRAEFSQWGAVQEAMDAEALAEAEALLASVAERACDLGGARPAVSVARGEAAPAILAHVAADPSIRALVLAAAAKGAPGPLIDFFAGERAGGLPCLVMIVPGGLDADRLAELT